MNMLGYNYKKSSEDGSLVQSLIVQEEPESESASEY
jgi:hypothetical protein